MRTAGPVRSQLFGFHRPSAPPKGARRGSAGVLSSRSFNRRLAAASGRIASSAARAPACRDDRQAWALRGSFPRGKSARKNGGGRNVGRAAAAQFSYHSGVVVRTRRAIRLRQAWPIRAVSAAGVAASRLIPAKAVPGLRSGRSPAPALASASNAPGGKAASREARRLPPGARRWHLPHHRRFEPVDTVVARQQAGGRAQGATIRRPGDRRLAGRDRVRTTAAKLDRFARPGRDRCQPLLRIVAHSPRA